MFLLMSIYLQCTVVKNVFIFSGVATPVSLKGACNTASSGSACPSPVSSDSGGTFPQELIDNFALNLYIKNKLSINSLGKVPSPSDETGEGQTEPDLAVLQAPFKETGVATPEKKDKKYFYSCGFGWLNSL